MYDGMSACSKAWLQYVFPIWLILKFIVIFAHFSINNCFACIFGRFPYCSCTFDSSLVILHKTNPHVLSSLMSPVWRVSDTLTNEHSVLIEILHILISGCHLPLLISGLLVLTFIITSYTIFLLTIPVLAEAYLTGKKIFRWVLRLKPVMDAYGGPYIL